MVTKYVYIWKTVRIHNLYERKWDWLKESKQYKSDTSAGWGELCTVSFTDISLVSGAWNRIEKSFLQMMAAVCRTGEKNKESCAVVFRQRWCRVLSFPEPSSSNLHWKSHPDTSYSSLLDTCKLKAVVVLRSVSHPSSSSLVLLFPPPTFLTSCTPQSPSSVCLSVCLLPSQSILSPPPSLCLSNRWVPRTNYRRLSQGAAGGGSFAGRGSARRLSNNIFYRLIKNSP